MDGEVFPDLSGVSQRRSELVILQELDEVGAGIVSQGVDEQDQVPSSVLGRAGQRVFVRLFRQKDGYLAVGQIPAPVVQGLFQKFGGRLVAIDPSEPNEPHSPEEVWEEDERRNLTEGILVCRRKGEYKYITRSVEGGQTRLWVPKVLIRSPLALKEFVQQLLKK